jgi:conjugal transfer mating pair stabilization protein TraG
MWTLYTSSGDVVLLNAIFNGVAMIANNVALVWGFAIFAAMLLTTRTTAAAMIETHRHAGGPVLTRGALHMAAPIFLAMVLTSSDLKVTLTIENTTTGVTSSVANVPIIIAAIPVGGSAMANAIGPAVTTAMSGVNPSYGDITVSGHGFIDPMRRLLAARGAIEHLGSSDTELRIVLGRCLSMEAGTDFSKLNNLVMNAGNSGATAAQSIAINGANPTGVGALLYQAAQNTTGLVPELAIGNTTILNCSDAAALVAADLSAALASVEFPRVVQGAVNGLDQPLPGADYGIGQFLNEYNAMRNWNSMSGTLAVGAAQANAEMINFLFDEEVSAGLNCAQASESNKTVCEATMIQATELERNNLQAAANEVPMLQYSGAFGNYILALIIGLGPVIVMFMMLFGVEMGKCMKTSMHILVWPLLVTNVGAELVNAMLTMQFSNFMNSISQGGYLSPAAIHSAYKELSLQVGVGSHIMASLPVLMSMIFALGEAAGMASVAAEVNPKGNETGKAEAPSPIESAPLMRATSRRPCVSLRAVAHFRSSRRASETRRLARRRTKACRGLPARPSATQIRVKRARVRSAPPFTDLPRLSPIATISLSVSQTARGRACERS